MIKSISNSVSATNIFIAIFILAILASIRKQKVKEFFSLDTTQELKGFAILAVVFSHIGYFLVSDHNFLHPLTIIAGVGVDLFLILSGYGLVMSSLKKDQSIWQFYKTRLIRLFVPMWIVLILFFTADYFILNIKYSWGYIVQAFFGIFRTADLYTDINSPLWYFTLILFFYLVFPLVFSKKRPWLSALIIYVLGYLILKTEPYRLSGNIYMYKIHLIGFPLGMFIASLVKNEYIISLQNSNFVKKNIDKFKQPNVLNNLIYYFIFFILVYLSAYFSYNSGVGKGLRMEQGISILTAMLLLALFLMKRFDIRLFNIFGVYSYEIYLLHWPLLYSYDVFYQYFPAWLATALYLPFFLGLSVGLQRLSKVIVSKI